MRRAAVLWSLVLLVAAPACSCDPTVQRVSGRVELDSGALDFGSVCVGDTARVRLGVLNAGTVPLHISAVSAPAGFGVESFPDTLAAAGQDGSTGEILVTFTPTAAGDVFGDLLIESDDLERPEVRVRLNGTGDDGVRVDLAYLCEAAGGGSLEDCPATLSFDDVGVGLVSEIPVVLDNRGCALITVTDVQVTDLGGVPTTDGWALTSPSVPFDFSNALQQTVVPSLSPTDANTYVARIAISWEDVQAGFSDVATLSMFGNGVRLDLIVRPPSFIFGSADVNTPQTQTFTIENTGGQSGTIEAMALRDASTEFTLSPSVTLPALIAGLGTPECPASCTLTFDVTYAPEDAQADENAVLITTGVGEMPPVAIAGGPVPQIEVTPATLDFGVVATGDTVTLDVTVRNVGQADLNVTEFRFPVNPASVFSVSAAPPLPQTLPPTASFTFTVQFADNPGIGKGSGGGGQSEVGDLEIVNDDPGYVGVGGAYLLHIDTDTNANFGPTANLRTFVDGVECSVQPCAAETGQTGAFDASFSTDPENDVLLFAWEIRSQPPGGSATLSPSGPNATLVPDFPGRWEIRVTATDPFGNSNQATSELSVTVP